MPTNRKYGITLHPPEDGMRTFSFSTEKEMDKERFVGDFHLRSEPKKYTIVKSCILLFVYVS